MTEEGTQEISTRKKWHLEHKDTMIKRGKEHSAWKKSNKPDEVKALRQIYNQNYIPKQRALCEGNSNKRPIGRPRKSKPLVEQDTTSNDMATSSEEAPVPKPLRGRPRRYDPAEALKAFILRPPGRAKKEKTGVDQ